MTSIILRRHGSVSTNVSSVRLPLLQSSVLSQCSTAVAHSTHTELALQSHSRWPLLASYRAAAASVTAPLAAAPGRPQTAVTPGTLPMPFSPIDASGARPSQMIPRKFQVVALPGTTQPASTPGGLQAVVVPSGKLPTVVPAGALQPLALQGTLQAAVPAVPLKTFSVAGKLPAEANAGTLRAAAVSGKLQTVAASPGTLQASQNVIMLQSSNGLVQLVQLPANCVRNANVLNFAGQGSAVVPRQTCIVTSPSATASHLLTHTQRNSRERNEQRRHVAVGNAVLYSGVVSCGRRQPVSDGG
jgi:hypothetical protein